MKRKELEKKAAKNTALKILTAAQKVFVEKGFEGSSINDIASEADINKSLIYHHFGSKADLWKAVKAHILTLYQARVKASSSDKSFREFLHDVVHTRFKFYEENPDIPRLISWQRLERGKDELRSTKPNSIISIMPELTEFKKRGELRARLNLSMVEHLIIQTASSAFMDKPAFIDDKTLKKQYIAMIIDCLYRALSAEHAGE